MWHVLLLSGGINKLLAAPEVTLFTIYHEQVVNAAHWVVCCFTRVILIRDEPFDDEGGALLFVRNIRRTNSCETWNILPDIHLIISWLISLTNGSRTTKLASTMSTSIELLEFFTPTFGSDYKSSSRRSHTIPCPINTTSSPWELMSGITIPMLAIRMKNLLKAPSLYKSRLYGRKSFSHLLNASSWSN